MFSPSLSFFLSLSLPHLSALVWRKDKASPHPFCHTSNRISLTSLVPASFLLWSGGGASVRGAELHGPIKMAAHCCGDGNKNGSGWMYELGLLPIEGLKGVFFLVCVCVCVCFCMLSRWRHAAQRRTNTPTGTKTKSGLWTCLHACSFPDSCLTHMKTFLMFFASRVVLKNEHSLSESR